MITMHRFSLGMDLLCPARPIALRLAMKISSAAEQAEHGLEIPSHLPMGHPEFSFANLPANQQED